MQTMDTRAGGTKRRGAAKTVLAMVLCAALGGAVSATKAVAQPEAAAGPGLRGVLPPQVPRDLDFEAFLQLGENWQEWGEAAAADVARLYTEELDVPAQRETLAALRARLRVMQRAIGDPRYRSIHDPLVELHGRLQQRVDIAEAALDTLEAPPAREDASRVETTRVQALGGLRSTEAWLNTVVDGRRWLPYLRSAELAAALASPEAAPAETVPLLEDVLSRLRRREGLEAPQRGFLSRPQFQTLESALASHLAALRRADADADPERLRAELAAMLQALEAYALDSSAHHAAAARRAYENVRGLSPDGGRRLSRPMRTHYFNYNVEVVASEQLLSRFVADVRTESGPVRDQVMGASIFGNQVTTTRTGLDLKPSHDGARFQIVVHGDIHSNTAGVTSQATVYSTGRHQFSAVKEVFTDGQRFHPAPARIGVNANNFMTGARTPVSGVPLVGKIVDGIALKEANRRRPEGEAITRSRIAQEALPVMDREVDSNLARAERDLHDGPYRRLREAGLYPAVTRLSTTEQHLQFHGRVWNRDELGGSAPVAGLTQPRGVTIHLHESWLNNAVDRMDFAGRTMTDAQVRAELERFLSEVAGRPVTLENGEEREDGEDLFLFDGTDPIRFQIRDGALNLIIRAGLRPEGRDEIPTQVVTVPLRMRVEPEHVYIERGTPRVAPAEAPPSRAEQIVRAGIMRRRIEEAIPDTTRERRITISVEDRPDVDVWITRMKSLNGWLTIWAE